MEKLAKCKVLIGTYINDNIILGGPHVAEFETRDNKFFIKIEQCGYRKISIKASEEEKQIKTCRKLQHVKRYMEKNVSKIIRRLTAVGKNYNSTRDNIVLIHTLLYLNNYSVLFHDQPVFRTLPHNKCLR